MEQKFGPVAEFKLAQFEPWRVWLHTGCSGSCVAYHSSLGMCTAAGLVGGAHVGQQSQPCTCRIRALTFVPYSTPQACDPKSTSVVTVGSAYCAPMATLSSITLYNRRSCRSFNRFAASIGISFSTCTVLAGVAEDRRNSSISRASSLGPTGSFLE